MDPVPFDDRTELLFLRIKEEHVLGSGVLPAVVDLPDWSTNRERFSAPEDVLDADKYPGFTRIGEFAVGDIPPRIESDPPQQKDQKQAAPWEFWAEHDPLLDNFAHSEVRMKKEGEPYRRNRKPSSSAYRKKIRSELARMVRVRDVEQ